MLLAEAMGIPEARRSAFLGRFQHFQRLGLITGVKPGRGRAAEYTMPMILQLAVAFELVELGRTPERIVEHLGKSEFSLASGFRDALADDGIIYIFSESTLTIQRGDRPEPQTYERRQGAIGRLSWIGNGEDHKDKPDRLAPLMGRYTRGSFLNLSRIFQQIANYIQRENIATFDQIRADVEEWAASQ